jgi:stage II sporulation protein AA (anti-sigma F factor antagonist)
MDFKVSTSPIDHDGLLISVEGELDLFTVNDVQRSAEPAISARRPLLLDLSECPFIDSTGLRLVLKIHEVLTDGEGSGAPMAVVASSDIRKFFSLTAIDLSVPVFPNRGQALKSLAATGSHSNTPDAS